MDEHQPHQSLQPVTEIFIKNATIADFAVLIPGTGPVGISRYVDITWKGMQDTNGFVFDFGPAKATAKNIIDTFFDHKLLIQKSDIRKQYDQKAIIANTCQLNGHNGHFALHTNSTAYRIVEDATMQALAQEDFSLLEKEMASAILAVCPKNIFEIKVCLREDLTLAAPLRFSYTHSLCKHNGNCQRFHGHTGAVEIFRRGTPDFEEAARLSAFFKNFYFISAEYAQDTAWENSSIREILSVYPEISASSEKHVAVCHTGSQGEVALILPEACILKMNAESTVENIAGYIRTHWVSGKENVEVRVYEGLAKGAVCR